MSNVVPATVTKAAQAFRASIAEEYELESDFLDTMERLFVKAASPLASVAEAAGKKAARAAKDAAPAKVRAPRKKSAYNVYVREQMKTAEIQAISHKEKMSAIASGWNGLNDEQKKVYADLATGENLETDETQKE
jgi:hypothetical protein